MMIWRRLLWGLSAKLSKFLNRPHNSSLFFSSPSITRKTVSLAWTLVKHFKRDLIIQALWAAFASLFVFAPTLLLRVILEYIERPEDTPKNVAWLFVTLLLVTASIVAIGNGQALFIGRRICIRLRAVVIGEVYAKALRRKAAAGTEKNLGGKKKGDKATSDDKDISQTNAGAIINLMAVDSFKVSEVCAYLHFLVRNRPFISFTVYLTTVVGCSGSCPGCGSGGIAVSDTRLELNCWHQRHDYSYPCQLRHINQV
jgi:hypothetical protein